MLFLLFQIGNDRYALEAQHAVEVIPFLALKKIPQSPRGMAGIFNYRGQPVPAFDLCELTLGRPAEERLSTRIIIVKGQGSVEQGREASAAQPATHSAQVTHRTPLLGLIAEHATEMMQRDQREFVDPGVNVDVAPYLGPVLMDAKGVIQLIHPSRIATLAGEMSKHGHPFSPTDPSEKGQLTALENFGCSPLANDPLSPAPSSSHEPH